MKEEIVFAITEELIQAEALQEMSRYLTNKELDEVTSKIQSESIPIFEFIRVCIRKKAR